MNENSSYFKAGDTGCIIKRDFKVEDLLKLLFHGSTFDIVFFERFLTHALIRQLDTGLFRVQLVLS